MMSSIDTQIDIGNNYYHAEALAENGKDEEAKNYLMKALSMSPDPDNFLEKSITMFKRKRC